MASTIKNFWKGVTFFCMNHEDPIEMVLMEGETPFFACPKYMRLDKEHPEGHGPHEPACPNRLSFADAAKVVEKLAGERVDSVARGEFCSFENYQFVLKGTGIRATVLHYEDGDKAIGIFNKRAFA